MAADSKTTDALDLADVFAQIGAQASDGDRIPEPDWYTPNDVVCDEARRFRLVSNGGNGDDDLDEAVVRHLLRLRYDRRRDEVRNYAPYRNWYEAPLRLVRSPAKTCPGLVEAGAFLSQAISDGRKIAVYCDYDVDGTSGGAAFQLAVAPYGADLHFGFADAQQGFGLTDAFVHEAHAAGADVLITLDCGTSQATHVALAQSLGMTVIVVDHHDIADNPADFHINPKLHEPVTSQNTGAQLAFKLGAAIQIAREGRTRPDLWERPLKLAGLGALADMGSVMLHENRAFFWAAADHPMPGYAALAHALGEDPTWPGQNVLTQAVLNLPKRTVHADAADIFQIFTATSAQQAAPVIEKLLAIYELAKPVRLAMQQDVIEQTGEMTVDEDGVRVRSRPEELIAFAVVDGYAQYAGYTGVVAGRVTDRAGKPTFVVALKDEFDSQGRQIAKLSGRPAYGCPLLAQLADDEEIERLCTIEKLDESGQLIQKPTFGGHAHLGVFAGSVYVENIPALQAAIRRVAASVAAANNGAFFPAAYDGPSASVAERKVPAARLAKVERDARRLGPFARDKQLMLEPADGHRERLDKLPEPKVSVCGRLIDLKSVQDSPGWLEGRLDLGDGVFRDVRYPENADERPEGLLCEWVLKLGRPGEYWLRTFHPLELAPA